MRVMTISGNVLDTSGNPVPNAWVKLTSDLTTLGCMPGAVAAITASFHWTRLLSGFAGDRWHAYTKFIAPTTAGISFAKFKELIVEHNPSLAETAYLFEAERTYLLPEAQDDEQLIAWQRTLTDFQGNRWQCWQRYIAGKVPGLTWLKFKEQVIEQNPTLLEDNAHFLSNKRYQLPQNLQQHEYAVDVMTDHGGRFKIAHLPVGAYRMTVYAPGFLPQSQEINLHQDVILPPFLIAEPVIATVVEKSDYVAVRPGSLSFWRNGTQMRRFIGLNMTLLPHYGKTYRELDGQDKKVLPHSELHHRQSYLDQAKSMNAKVIRCFLPHYGVPNEEVATRFEEILALAHARDLYILPAFIDLYHNRGAYPDAIHPNDSAVYKQQGSFSRLTSDFFTTLHETLFMPFVEFIVQKFHTHQLGSRIFAWEIGNELKWDDRPADFVNFMLKIAGQIKALDPSHMVTTGMKSTQHAYMFNQPALADKLYRSDLLDFITIHSYVDPRPKDHETQRIEEQRIEEQGIENDAKLARRLGKPLLVEEAGIANVLPEPKQLLLNHMEHWFDKQLDTDDKHQAYGYMQWGFDPDGIGDGDRERWPDYKNKPAVDAMINSYLHQSSKLQPF